MSLAPAAAHRLGTSDVHAIPVDTRRSGPLSGAHASVCGVTADDWILIDYFAYPAPGLECCKTCLQSAQPQPGKSDGPHG